MFLLIVFAASPGLMRARAADSFGNAIVLNGADYFRTTLWSPALFSNKSFTFELWFNAATPGALIGEADTADVTKWDYLFAEVFPNGIIKVGVPGVPTITLGGVQFGTWHHLALSYDQGSQTLNGYLDGQLAGTSSGDRTVPSQQSRSAVYCFGRGGPANLGGGNWFSGKMDEVRIWNIARAGSAILAAYNKLLVGTESGLMGYWHFDTASQGSSPDASTKSDPAVYVPITATPALVTSDVPLPGSQTLQTLTAIVDAQSVQLNGSANAGGSPMTVYFEWGNTTAYGNSTPIQDIGNGSVDIKFSALLSSVPPGEYHFRAVANASGGKLFGGDQKFSVVNLAGNAVSLRGNDYLRTTLWSHQLFTDENFTFELWFNATSAGGLVDEADTSDPSVWDYNFAEIFPDGTIKAGVPGVPTLTVGTVPLGTWHHLAVVYDQSQKRLFAYLDGQLAGSSGGDRTTPAEISRTSVYTFGRGGPKNLGGGAWFQGQIDEIRIWNRPLSSNEVAIDFNRVLAGTQTGLVGYWQLDSSSGYTSPDASSKNNPAWYVPGPGFPLVVSQVPLLRPKPILQTLAATSDSPEAARLNGLVNPQGNSLSVFFEWGSTTAYGNSTPAQAIGNGQADVNFNADLSSLAPGEYHYRAVASVGGQFLYGADQNFATRGIGANAIVMSGNDYFRTTTWSPQLFKDKNFTFELWFNAVGPGALFGEADTADVNQWDYLFAEVEPGGIVRAGVPGVTAFTAGTVQFGTWHHFALTYDQITKLLSAYIDGQPSGSSSGDRIRPEDRGRTAVYPFARGGPTNLGGGAWFVGKMDEVRIWNRALSAGEIATAFDKVILAAQTGLMAYWHFDAASPGSSPDATTNGDPALYVPLSATPTLVASGAPLHLDQRPAVLSLTTKNIHPFLAQFSGSINGNGALTSAAFQYSVSNLTVSTDLQDVGQGTTPVNLDSFVDGLIPGVTYTVRLVASNSFGVTYGPEVSFLKTGLAGLALSVATNQTVRTTSALDSLFPDETITLELWFRARTAGVLAGEVNAVNPSGWDRSVLEILPSGDIEAGFSGLQPVSLGHAEFGAWNHIALRYDKSALKMDGFLNGRKTGSVSGDRTSPTEAGARTYFAFGKSARTKLGTGDFLGGDLDEIRVWNIARTDTEIRTQRNQALAGSERGLVFYWRFDDLGTNTVDDSSSNKIGGQVLGGAKRIYSDVPLAFTSILFGEPGKLNLKFLGLPSASYRLEATEDFLTWTTVGTSTASGEGAIAFDVTPAAGRARTFYRLRQQ